MAKKKRKKKTSKINPHKLSEAELIKLIEQKLENNKIKEAYNFVKVLYKDHRNSDNQKRFEKVLEKKIENLVERELPEDANRLLSEFKNKYPEINIDRFLDITNAYELNPAELIETYRDRNILPTEIRCQIADALFFNKALRRSFIKKHREFKDVFYVDEAIDKIDDLKSARILISQITSKSPYHNYRLLFNAINAYYNDDLPMLEILSFKADKNTLPNFVINKLWAIQEKINTENVRNLTMLKNDLPVFEILLGDTFVLSLILKIIKSYLSKNQRKKAVHFLIDHKRYISQSAFQNLYILTLTHCTSEDDMMRELLQDTVNDNQLVRQIMIPDYAIDADHISIKIGESRSLLFDIPFTIKELWDGLLEKSKLINRGDYPPEVIKAEISYHLAKKGNYLIASDDYDYDDDYYDDVYEDGDNDECNIDSAKVKKRSDHYLERSLEYSQHNPEIFKYYIEYLLKQKAKRSEINDVMGQFLINFNDNPDAYKLAGDIAFENQTYPKALKYYRNAVRLSPINAEVKNAIFDCLVGIIKKRKLPQQQHLLEKDFIEAHKYSEGNGDWLFKIQLLKLNMNLELFNKKIRNEPEKEFYLLFETNQNNFIRLCEIYSTVDAYSYLPIAEIFRIKTQEAILNLLDFNNLFTLIKLTDFFDQDNPICSFDLYQFLILHYLKSIKKSHEISEKQIIKLLILCANKNFFNTFIVFLHAARYILENKLIFEFMIHLLHVEGNKEKLYIRLPKILNWLSVHYQDFVVPLSNHFLFFKLIHESGSNNKNPSPKELEDTITKFISGRNNCDINDLFRSAVTDDFFAILSLRNLFKMKDVLKKEKRPRKRTLKKITHKSITPKPKKDYGSKEQLDLFD